MNNLTKKISLAFAAGCFGGLLNSLAVWIFGKIGITTAMGVKITPPLTALWLYPRLVWGGIWGVLFLLPLLKRRPFLRGLIFSLGPTVVQLFVVFPMKAQKGVMGFDLGLLTPGFVILFNAIWGLAAAFWLKWATK